MFFENYFLEIGLLTYVLSYLVSVLLPYLLKVLDSEDGIKFDYRYAATRLVGALFPVGVAVLNPTTTEALKAAFLQYSVSPFLYIVAVIMIGYGASQTGRTGDSAYKILKNMREG